MDENAIRDKYLELFSIHWDSSSILEPLQELRKQANEAGLNHWARLIDARSLRAQRRFDEALSLLKEVRDPPAHLHHVRFLQAAILSEVPGRREEAVRICDSLIADLSGSRDLSSRYVTSMTLINKGVALVALGKPQDALAAYDAVIHRFGAHSDAPTCECVATALVDKGVALARSGRLKEALAAWDDLLRHFADRTELLLRTQVARTFVNKGVAFGKLGRPSDELAAYDEALRRFRGAPEQLLREAVAYALYNKGLALRNLDRPLAALGAHDEVVRRFRTSPELPLRQAVARALFGKGLALSRLNKLSAAAAAFDDLIRSFSDSDDEVLSICVGAAHTEKAKLAKARHDKYQAEKSEDAAFKAVHHYSDQLKLGLKLVMDEFPPEKVTAYFSSMEARKKRTDEFLLTPSRFRDDASFLLVLREWNSYTPAIPAAEERDRGGGYFIRHAGLGIVIDPGYDFIQNFYEAGAVLADIDAIILTHAHDDHTAELEQLLMLLHQRQRRRKGGHEATRVRLYLSEGAQRKFAGLIALRDDPRIECVTTLSRQAQGTTQRIELSERVTLTVLPAYHDDVLTRDTAVGLGFEFKLDGGATRRVVFTADSGYYPRKLDADGHPEYYDPLTKQRPRVDCRSARELIEQYPPDFRQPDLLVAHIGSIQKEEFTPLGASSSSPTDETHVREEGEWYYVNHLGLLGTLTLLGKSRAPQVIVSEFGSELKGFNIELVIKLGAMLNRMRAGETGPRAGSMFVIPGDATMVYYIAANQFLCHEDSSPHAAADLECLRWDTFDVRGQDRTRAPDHAHRDTQSRRAHLFLKGTDSSKRDAGVENYYRNLFSLCLPHHKRA